MKLRQRVVVIAPWSHFRGREGRVVSLDPPMVHLDGEPKPLRFGLEAIAPAPPRDHHGGAELAPLFLPTPAAFLRSDTFELNDGVGSPFARACDRLDHDDGAFFTALSVLFLLVATSSAFARRWSR